MDATNRQDYIKAAVSFLQNPKLVESSLQDKLKFLREKGLTDVEVDEALNLALIDRQKSHGNSWNFLIVLGLCYSGYKLYKAYIDSRSESQTTAKSLEDEARLSKSTLKELPTVDRERSSLSSKVDSSSLSQILEEVRALKSKTDWCKNSLSSDIKALQTLLLGHEKLAAPPVIPAWQMDSRKKEKQLQITSDILADTSVQQIESEVKSSKNNKSEEAPVQND